MKGIWILLMILFILWLIGVLPIKLSVKVSNLSAEVKLKILFLSFALGKKKKKTPSNVAKTPPGRKNGKPQKKSPKKRKLSFGTVAAMIRPVPKIIRYILRGLKMDHVRVRIDISGEDAAQTAIQYGRVCAVVYPLLAFLKTQTQLKVEQFILEPDFYHDQTRYQAEGILSIRFYRILWSGLWYLGSVLKNVIGKSTRKKAAVQVA